MSRSRCFAVLLALAPLVLWTSCANGPGADPDGGAPKSKRPGDAAFEWQAQVICDWPELPAFEVEGTKVPESGMPCIVVVPGADPAEALKAAAAAASAHKFRAFWAAPDAAADEAARKAGVGGIAGAVAAKTAAAVGVEARPAVFVVGADGRIRFAHVGLIDPELLKYEMGEMRYELDFAAGVMSARRFVPPPAKEFKGALFCAGCHRKEFVDWQMTPHSVALEDLERIGRDQDPECIGCHVVGWEKGGYSDREKHRALADVQCEACHAPEKTHAPRPMTKDDYISACTKCHTQKFSLFSDFGKAISEVSHLKRDMKLPPYSARREFIGNAKNQMYQHLCGLTEYVGSGKCKSCHEKAHAQWSGTPHAKAFAALQKTKDEANPKCLACHATAFGMPTGFKDLATTPGFAEVGCESCHGPGLKHVGAKTEKEREGTMFAFDAKCPTCVVERICLTCHDSRHRPCVQPGESPFDLSTHIPRVRHEKR